MARLERDVPDEPVDGDPMAQESYGKRYPRATSGDSGRQAAIRTARAEKPFSPRTIPAPIRGIRHSRIRAGTRVAGKAAVFRMAILPMSPGWRAARPNPMAPPQSWTTRWTLPEPEGADQGLDVADPSGEPVVVAGRLVREAHSDVVGRDAADPGREIPDGVPVEE